MSWTPTSDRVLIRFDDPEEKVSPGGVLLPGKASEEPNRMADVVAVGQDCRDVSVGDRVLISGYAGVSMPSDEQQRMIHEDDVLVVLGGKR